MPPRFHSKSWSNIGQSFLIRLDLVPIFIQFAGVALWNKPSKTCGFSHKGFNFPRSQGDDGSINQLSNSIHRQVVEIHRKPHHSLRHPVARELVDHLSYGACLLIFGMDGWCFCNRNGDSTKIGIWYDLINKAWILHDFTNKHRDFTIWFNGLVSMSRDDSTSQRRKKGFDPLIRSEILGMAPKNDGMSRYKTKVIRIEWATTEFGV